MIRKNFLKTKGKIRDIAVPEGQAYRFTFPPGVPHAIKNPGPTPMLLIAFNTLEHDRANPDLVKDILIEG